MKIGLTERQEKLFDFIVGYASDRGYFPSTDNIAEFMGYKSRKAVYAGLLSLRKKGMIERSRRGKYQVSTDRDKKYRELGERLNVIYGIVRRNQILLRKVLDRVD